MSILQMWLLSSKRIDMSHSRLPDSKEAEFSHLDPVISFDDSL